ncbi:flagellar basal body-associated FliL family protein [Xanthomonas sp. XNM01]|uniref:flagellar basal body-associated FliL family protein n=1 Tax=Xanthomonas sp. XNM01 TaxID=2769289 RepID=UPI001783DF3B|nr:flagellar basal body-associated FliL family protein [Xanthomonas sp. XNM01]MBD9370934.1 flagellar basal body-associated FliL family protein [Xanthomonas sp. XNM01]
MRTLVIVLATLLLVVLGGGGYAWYARLGPFASAMAAGSTEAVPPPPPAAPPEHFVTLDKLVVMLRTEPQQTRARYLAIDLVFACEDKKKAARAKAQLPLLRSVAHRSLAGYRADEIRQMEIDDLVGMLESEYRKVYGSEKETPFSQVMIARMMLE